MDIQGSRTLIAGATGELGSALARAFCSEGAELALAGRNAERLGALGDELDASTARLDVRDPESSRTAVDAADVLNPTRNALPETTPRSPTWKGPPAPESCTVPAAVPVGPSG